MEGEKYDSSQLDLCQTGGLDGGPYPFIALEASMKGGGSNGQCVPGTWELSSNLDSGRGGTSSGPGTDLLRLLPSES